MLQNILLVANILVCCALIGVVLMQRSEGGALGMGGGPSGFMTARGAGDLLTRTTWILFVVFLVLSVSLTMLGGGARSVTEGAHIQAIDPSKLNQPPAGAAPATPTPGAPASGVPTAAPLTPGTNPGLPGAAPAAPPSNTGGFHGFPTAQEQMQSAQQQQQQMLQQQAAQRAAAMQAAQQQAAAQAATPHPVQVPAPVVVPPLAPAPSDSSSPPAPATPAPATNQ